MSALLAVDDLARRYALRSSSWPWSRPLTLRAVDGVSFRIEQGKTLGLVGESGCGKSTTARLVLGLLPPSSGSVRFEDQPVSSRRDAQWRALRRRMQMVYQDPLGALDRRLTALEQVCEPLAVFGEGLPAERRERARELMASVGLPRHLFERYPHELSGGQRQRVVLARALILGPALLVCDEPVSALDVSVQAQVINLLQQIQQRDGVAFLFISHDLKVVRHVSHEVAVMYLGRIVEQGPPQELLSRPAHPYTQALVSAVPTPWRDKSAERIVLQGDPPNPLSAPAGCSFHPRCRQQAPALIDIGGGRKAACHLLASS
ncbi:MAG: ATP-binding cassette domain-containing protein [Burkholderiales bacterium]|nr:ATP-binding cassette domain-containing protein [Burkholderiales bacterium]